jgi:hypothetical protein
MAISTLCENCGEQSVVMVDIVVKGPPVKIIAEGAYCPDCHLFIPIDEIEEDEEE